MDKKAIKALRGSIKKWERIVLGKDEDLGYENCPLCWKYHRLSSCDGCPVAEDTGKPLCEGSPYDKWMTSFYADLKELTGDNWIGEEDKCLPIGPRSLATAIAEYEYLCKLLNKELAKK